MPIDRRTFLHAMSTAALGVALGSCGRGVGDADVRAGDRSDLVVAHGGWCWFQAPRAAIDRHGTLWLGSTQGTGAPDPGRVEVTEVDLANWQVRGRTPLGHDRVDDHTSPSVLLVGDEVQVGWAPHRAVDWLELGRLGRTLQRIQRPGAIIPPGRGTSYVSAHVVAGQRWVLYRGEGFTWNLLTSDDGRRWTHRGCVLAPEPSGQRPYVAAASDGTRLHLVASDGNPTERLGTGVGYGSIGTDLVVRDGAGHSLGSVGHHPPSPQRLTRLIAGRPGRSETSDTDGWLCQLAVVHHRPTAILSLRDPWPSAAGGIGRWRHRLLWARQRATGAWTIEHLAWVGSELYANQPDYCGLGTIDPLDPTRAVVSSDVDPASGEPLAVAVPGGRPHRELFEGRRTAEGRWRWRALTSASTVDHLRPLLVSGGGHTVLAWMRGTYRSWTDFDTDLVVRTA